MKLILELIKIIVALIKLVNRWQIKRKTPQYVKVIADAVSAYNTLSFMDKSLQASLGLSLWSNRLTEGLHRLEMLNVGFKLNSYPIVLNINEANEGSVSTLCFSFKSNLEKIKEQLADQVQIEPEYLFYTTQLSLKNPGDYLSLCTQFDDFKKSPKNQWTERVENISMAKMGQITLMWARLLACKNLKTLNLAECSLNVQDLQKIPLHKLTRLVALNLSGNQINELPEYFNYLNLSYLNISRNQLRYLPVELTNFSSLKFLDISGNQISEREINRITRILKDTKIKF